MHIIVYTTPETLKHKQGDDYWGYFWKLRNLPKQFEDHVSRLYVATKGFIRGYFSGCYIDEEEGEGKVICFKGKDWVELEDPIPQKPFQGFKYFKQNDTGGKNGKSSST